MTAVAKLPEKWREAAKGERDYYADALRACADQLEAALSPAELGGVDNSDRYALRMLIAAGWVSESKANEALNIAHGFAKEPLSTPRADEADAAVAKLLSRVPLPPNAITWDCGVELLNELQRLAVERSALTPPSAKGECHD